MLDKVDVDRGTCEECATQDCNELGCGEHVTLSSSGVLTIVRPLAFQTTTTIGTLKPTLDGLSRVTRLRVETQLGLRSMLVHRVDQLLEQDEILRNRSHARADNNTIELLPLKSIYNECFRSFAEINQAQFRLVTQSRKRVSSALSASVTFAASKSGMVA
jgi:hypothetical protein